MKIYAATETLADIICPLFVSEGLGEVNLLDPTVLKQKQAYLVDVFNTFILPDVIEDDVPLERSVLAQKPRQGFIEFLRHYRGKIIGIHTDALEDTEMSKMGQVWGIDEYVQRYFGENYISYIDPRTGTTTNSVPIGGAKDFLRMCRELGTKSQDTLIIGDGKSELVAAIMANIDLLLVPPFYHDGTFSFEELI